MVKNAIYRFIIIYYESLIVIYIMIKDVIIISEIFIKVMA